MMIRFFILPVLSLIMVLNTMNCTGKDNDLKIYALMYGNSMFQKRFIFHGDKSGDSVPISWMFYYIEYGDKKILVDTGFNNESLVKMFRIQNFKDPVAILTENKIHTESITDIIITHSHFDHIGNIHRFKNARVIINRDELADLNRSAGYREINRFLSLGSNVTVFDNTYILYDIFNIHKIGGHTKGSSAVFFTYCGKNYCFTGDEVYSPDNITKNTGNGSVVNHSKNMDFINMLIRGKYTPFIMHDSKYIANKERFIRVFPVN